jgi:ribokinase
MAGLVGADAAGGWLRADVTGRGVDDSMLGTDPDAASGLALITVDAAGENTIVVHPGANARVAPPDPDRLDPQRWAVLLCSLEIPLESVASAMDSARRRGVTTVLNAAPMVGVGDGRLAAIIARTQVLVVNQSEADELFGGVSGPGGLEEAVVAWRAGVGSHAPEVVVTLGADGALVAGGEGTARFAAHVVRAASTVGAGDTFAGGLSLALSRGLSLGEAVRYAIAAAAAFLSGDLSEDAVAGLLGS